MKGQLALTTFFCEACRKTNTIKIGDNGIDIASN